jgi:hypothetical protein
MSTRNERQFEQQNPNKTAEGQPTKETPFEFEDFLTPTSVRETLFVALLAAVRRFPQPEPELINSDPNYTDTWVSKWPEFKTEVNELCSYLGIEVLPAKTFAELVIELSKEGFSAEQAESAARVYHKVKRGARVSARQRAVQALELRLAGPDEWTWKTLGEKFCEVGGPGHMHSLECHERIRQAVMALQKVLRKHGVCPCGTLRADKQA